MKENVYFCPACGSPSLEVSSLAGGASSCKSCPWTGTREELAEVPIEHAFMSQEEMVMRFVRQLSGAIAASSAQELGRVLLQWGFVDEKQLTQDLSAYIKAMALAATKAALETRQHLERARVNKARSEHAS